MCKEYRVPQSISHVFFECNKKLTTNRDLLNGKLFKYVQHYMPISMSEQEKLETILNRGGYRISERGGPGNC